MVHKRQSRDQEEGDGDFTNRHFKRTPVSRSVIEELARGVPTINEAQWETFFRRVVREELERRLFPNHNPSSSHHHGAGPSGGGSGLQLLFTGRIRGTLFTGSKVEAEEPGSILRVVLIDANTQSIVRTGPLSSIKVQLVALNGEFGSDDDDDDWSERDFESRVQPQREGRRPLVAGDLTLTLAEGVGVLGNVSFTDNSSWTRCRKFRLGARKLSPGEDRVREAKSSAFVVKDHRGELYQKHYPPRLNDEVWRLEKIAKDGAFHKRLAESRIDCVKDFVRRFVMDPSALRKILGTISKRTWSAIVDHAVTCVVDDNKLYTYPIPTDPRNVTVIFNSVYKVVGAGFNGHFLSLDQFTPSQTIVVENLKQIAYKNEAALVPLDELSFSNPVWPLAEPLNDSTPTIEPRLDYQACHHEQPLVTISTPTHPIGTDHPQFVLSQAHKNRLSREDFNLTPNFNVDLGGVWSTGGSSQVPIIQTNHLSPENLLHSPWNDQATTGFFFSAAPNDGYESAEAGIFPGFVHVSRHGKGRARWCKIRAAVKCMVSVMNKARTRRMSNGPLYLGY